MTSGLCRSRLPDCGLVLAEVDVEGMEFGPGELDSAGSSSDADDQDSLQGGGCSSNYGPPSRHLS